MHKVQVVNVFSAGPNGGNPAPIVADAAVMSDADMQQVARSHGLESGFVLPAPASSGCDFGLRFWVPNHEMEMCGHATVGAVWLLHHLRKLPGQQQQGPRGKDQIQIWTPSGTVAARISTGPSAEAQVQITQPQGTVQILSDETTMQAILACLQIKPDRLAPLPIQNARTSRVKTLIPMRDCAALHALQPDFSKVEALCERLGSTGLYPYARNAADEQKFHARQFPKSSGYQEDAATGIAAAALSFGLLQNGLVESTERDISIYQGWAMGRPSCIRLQFRLDPEGAIDGCWLGDSASLSASPS